MTCRRWDSNPHCLGPKPSASAVGLRRLAAHLGSPAAAVYLPLVYYVVVFDHVHPLVLGDRGDDVSGQDLDPVTDRNVLALRHPEDDVPVRHEPAVAPPPAHGTPAAKE